MIYYKLDKEISGEKILQDIQKLITKNASENLSNHILIINLQKITDYAGDNFLPKIEYKE